ncbi:sodium-dependent nutrient amino acid transporter 1 [Folsomia candida]|uniref:sodium-dependent nutrient amino acid transporter 1 n=1 Tax=Folsomia candida TaxID=158441 RepID=UPI000B905248|nr:sodium-dependent nutrient amino acid transporter 1 [Folsomia candida]
MEPAIPTVDVDSPPPYNDLPPQQQQGYLNDAFVPDGGDEEKSRKNLQFGDDPKHVTIWSKETDADNPEGEGDDEGRDVWDSPVEFLLSCISMSVGLGNVWRFPFTAYSNGGGAFLIPYIIVLIVIGRPIYYLEMCLGQFSRYGQVKIWNMAPIFKGVGYGSMIGTICVVSYYCSIMAVTIFYFFASFRKTLPWDYCDRSWGGGFCNENGTLNPTVNTENKTIASLYYTMEVFPQKNDISDGLGKPDWRLSLCLLASWIIIFFSLWKGVKSSGKVAYFTAIFPYVVLTIMLIRGVTLNGAWKGIKYFIEPQWDKIYEPKVWSAAIGQCFFSLGTGFGPIIMFSSYNPFRHNVYRDALVISFMDTFTSILAGCTIFAVLGHLSEETGRPIEDVTDGGAGLAFVSYPEAIAKFTFVPQLFAVLFFLMLFTLGIGSATSLTSGVITIICDQFQTWKRWLVTLIVCVIGFFSGLLYVTEGGNALIDFIDFFGANFVVYLMAMLEVGAIAWVYGLNSFCKDIEFMLDRKVGWYWKICWAFIIPVGLFVILVYTMATQEQMLYNGVPYPTSAIACGWILAGGAVLVVPAAALHSIRTRKSQGFVEKFKEALQPTKHWGPKNPKLRREWEEFKKNN